MELASISRRNFVKAATVAGVTIAAFNLVGCAPAEQKQSGYTAGTYTGTGHGKFGPVVVETTFSEDAITEVKVTQSEESKFIGDAAIEKIPAAIVEQQALGIDTVTGATLTSSAIMTAVADCVKQAGGKPSDLEKNYQAPEPSTAVEEIEADLVIAGAGGSGMACAIAAAQLGIGKVVMLEKSCTIGGNALVSGGYLEYVNAPDDLRPEMTDSNRAELEEQIKAAPEFIPADAVSKIESDWKAWQESGNTKCFDSLELQALQYTLQGEGGYAGNVPFCQNIAEVTDWLAADGVDFGELVGIVGYSWPRWTHPTEGMCGQGYFLHYNRQLDSGEYDIQILLNTPATKLITEGDKVIGVIGKGPDGTTYNVTSKHGVVLATGGFSGSPEMLKKYNTSWPFDNMETIPTTNTYGHTGDGINMALELGAGVGGMEDQMHFTMEDVKNSSDENTVGDDVDILMVNKNGERFMDEVRDRYSMTADIMEQPDQMMFMISDADTCRAEGELNRYGHKLQTLIDEGQLYVADTIEELGEKMGVDVNTFKATVDRYNEICRAGEDPDFGRTSFSELSPIENPPFYASPRTWAMHITVGGLLYDDNFNVTTDDGTPIEGLYAVGETIVGSSGVGTQGEGLALARILTA